MNRRGTEERHGNQGEQKFSNKWKEWYWMIRKRVWRRIFAGANVLVKARTVGFAQDDGLVSVMSTK